VRAAILAGGEGKRLRPLTESVPKPLLPVGDRPILQLIIEQLRRDGFHDIHIATGYRGDMIESYFGDGSDFNVNIQYSHEEQPLGTAGPLRLIENIGGESILTINGDILTEASFAEIYRLHHSRNPALTVCTVPHSVKIQYGVLQSNGDGIDGIVEKPELKYDIFAGIAVLGQEAIDCIPHGQPYQMTDVIEQLCNSGSQVIAYSINEFWIDIGRPEQYEEANDLLAAA